MSHKDINNIDDWIEKLVHANIPILNISFQKIMAAADQSKKGSEEVTQAILKDASLTLQVLRIANSGSNVEKVNTVTAAVERIGIDGVLGLCVSVIQLDSLKDHPQRAHLYRHMVTSYHAKALAQSIFPIMELEGSEQLLIATLIMHLGELCFWSNITPQSQRFHDLLSKNKIDSITIENELLGTSFNEIGLALAQAWHLGNPLCKVLKNPQNPAQPTASILLADDISTCICRDGWQSHEFTTQSSRLCQDGGIGINKAKELLTKSSQQASSELTSYGFSDIGSIIPGS